MKRIWFVWLGWTFVVGNLIAAILLLFKCERLLALMLMASAAIPLSELWRLRHYLFDRREY